MVGKSPSRAVDAFGQEFAAAVGAHHAAALSSGTAALHLALLLAGVGPGDEVLVSTPSFSASVNPLPISINRRPQTRLERHTRISPTSALLAVRLGGGALTD